MDAMSRVLLVALNAPRHTVLVANFDEGGFRPFLAITSIFFFFNLTLRWPFLFHFEAQ